VSRAAYMREYRAARPWKRKQDVESAIAWQKAHPEKAAAARERYRAKICARITAAKSMPCADCGGRFPEECMDFDHVRGTKVAGIARLRGSRPSCWKKIEAEIAKCELVCANCHRIRSKQRARAA
jgi:hypothetical protein